MSSLKDTVPRLVQQIVDISHPIRIVLFGSVATGVDRAGSDIDLLVVVPNGTPRRKTAQLLYMNLRNIGVPFDLVVATPEILEKNKNNPGLIYRDILKDGKEVYVAP